MVTLDVICVVCRCPTLHLRIGRTRYGAARLVVGFSQSGYVRPALKELLVASSVPDQV